MQVAPEPQAGSDTVLPHRADRSALVKLRRRFVSLNRERLRRITESLSPNQRPFLELLPLLFHTNHPAMPGYVGQDTPVGVADYTPSQRTVRVASRLARSFALPRRAHHSLDVQALYLMGSSGTVAQSSSSDLDFWVCHRPELEPGAVEQLRARCVAIEKWAATLGLEVHFFVLTDRQFRDGTMVELSSESSGSAQHHLLLDEFYRTGVLVAGLMPIWWFVPVSLEDDYDAYVRTLVRHRFVRDGECLDFGPVANISPSEFFGAALWQLAKAVNAPHKSLLKILLLEAYAMDYPRLDLLSLRRKRALHAGNSAIDDADPYVTMLGKIEEHLIRLKDPDRLELARRSFYFKAGIPLGQPGGRATEDWRRELLQSLVDTWDLKPYELSELDQRARWKVERTLTERRALVGALTRSYKSLSRFAREHARETRVSERDMTILGRKLFTVFENKAGKVELINHGISDDLSEPALTLQESRTEDGQSFWLLSKGEASAAPLRRGWTALELIAWAHFNGILTPATRVRARAVDGEFEAREIDSVAEHLRRHHPGDTGLDAPIERYAAAPRAASASVFMNLGHDPLAHHTRDGNQLTTNRADPLSYSGWRTNLVQELDYLVVTTWGEILTFKYQGDDGLVAGLCEHLRWIARDHEATGALPVRCSAPRHGEHMAGRLGELFSAVSSWFVTPGGAERRRFVLRIGNRYHVLLAVGDVPTHEHSGTLAELQSHLGKVNESFTAVTFDGRALDDPLLAEIFAANREGVIQFFYGRAGDQALVFVLDENGALFRDTLPFYTESALLSHFDRFFESIALRRSDPLPPGGLAALGPDSAFGDAVRLLEDHRSLSGPPVRYHRVHRHRGGQYRLDAIDFVRPDDGGGYFDLQVLGETVAGKTSFTLHCGQREFSTREYGARVFEKLTEHIVGIRQSGGTYPVYISDLDLSRLALEEGQIGGRQTIDHLKYKQRIERRLTAVLAARTPRGRAVNSSAA